MIKLASGHGADNQARQLHTAGHVGSRPEAQASPVLTVFGPGARTVACQRADLDALQPGGYIRSGCAKSRARRTKAIWNIDREP